MSPFLISQLLAAATLITGMAAFQLHDRKLILRGWSLAAAFAATHFFVLGSNEAAVLIVITGIRFLVSSFTTDKRLMYLFLGLNGFRIDAAEEDVVALILALASGQLEESALADWIRDHMTPR